jgi:UDP-GlcNAc:undecaprenyl-phosphate/decaprenyl-phosphate GlcNAc-1-phosphate transferase
MNITANLSILVCVFSTLLSFIVNRFFIGKAFNLSPSKSLVQPRWAVSPKSAFGGVSFYIVFICVSIFHFPSYLFLSLTIAFCFGFADDSFNFPPYVKCFGQFLVAVCLISGKFIISISDYVLVNQCFTILWVVGMMNSINMLDNMDGIVSSVSLVSLGLALMIIISSKSQNLTDITLITAVIGALIGFLYFNWNPAKIYMGDTGSQFLGAFLSWVSIQYFWQFRDFTEGGVQVKQFLIPALAFIVPLIDTVTVTLRRLARGVSPFVGGRDHTTHHLAYLGIKDKNVVRIMIFISIVSVLVAINILPVLNSLEWHWSFSLATIIYYLTIFFGMQYFYEVAKQRNNQSKHIEREEVIRIEGYDEVLN